MFFPFETLKKKQISKNREIVKINLAKSQQPLKNFETEAFFGGNWHHTMICISPYTIFGNSKPQKVEKICMNENKPPFLF